MGLDLPSSRRVYLASMGEGYPGVVGMLENAEGMMRMERMSGT